MGKKNPIFGQYNLLAEFEQGEPLESFIVRKGHPNYDEYILAWLSAERFGLDIETYALEGKSALDPIDGSIRLIQIAVEDDELGEFVIIWDLDEEELGSEIEALGLQLADPSVLVVGHNLLFDLTFLRVKFGFRATSVRDTMLFSQILWAGVRLTNQGMLKHSLAAVAERYDIEVSKDQQVSDWGVTLTTRQLNYAAKDALVVLKLLPLLGRDLRTNALLFSAEAECLALPAFVEMQAEGLPVCEETLDKVLRQYEDVRQEVLVPFKKKFPLTNPASPEKVLYVLRGTFKVQELENTSAQTLFQLSQEVPESEEVVKSLYLWRSLGTQVEYLKSIKSNIRGGRVRSNFRPIGPSGAGRSTSSTPNLQNPSNLKPSWKKLGLPPIRDIFKAPAGRKLIISDLSSAHARIAAQASRDRTLLESYNGGADLHCLTAAGIARWRGKDWSHAEINEWCNNPDSENHFEAKRLRAWSKSVFYGSLNFQSGFTLKDTFLKNEEYIDEETCNQMIEAWQETYRDLYQYQWDIWRRVDKSNVSIQGSTYGETRGLTGRRFFVEKVDGKFKITDAIAFTWLSTEADIIKKAMGLIYLETLNKPEWELRIVNFAHDEIDLEVSEEFAVEAAQMVLNKMNECMSEVITVIPAYGSTEAEELVADRWSEK